MTAVQLAIEKIDEKIEIAQVSRVEASKVKDATSTDRHHGAKIALVFIRQELVNLLEMDDALELEFSLDKSIFDKMASLGKPKELEEPKQERERGITITHVGKPKQETLKEVAKGYSERHQDVSGNLGKYLVKAVFQDGAKWQQERMYSEEDVINALHSVELKDNKDYSKIYTGIKEWFEQFKKK